MSDHSSDRFPSYDGREGVTYLRFQREFKIAVARNIIIRTKLAEEDKIDALQAEIEHSMVRFSPADAYYKEKEEEIFAKLKATDDGYDSAANAPNKITVRVAMKRFWELFDKKFKKPNPNDLAVFYDLHQKHNETPGAFGARFQEYHELIKTNQTVPAPIAHYLSRLHPSIKDAATAQYGLIEIEADQTMKKAISIADRLWTAIQNQEFSEALTGRRAGQQTRKDFQQGLRDRGIADGADQQPDAKPEGGQGKWCPRHNTDGHDASECRRGGKPKATQAPTLQIDQDMINLAVANLLAQSGMANPKVNPRNKLPGGQQGGQQQEPEKFRCTKCRSNYHDESQCRVILGIEMPGWPGPRNPSLHQEWRANVAARKARESGNAANVAAQPAPSTSTGITDDQLKQAIMAAFSELNFTGVVFADAHSAALKVNHQEMPLGFDLIDDSDHELEFPAEFDESKFDSLEAAPAPVHSQQQEVTINVTHPPSVIVQVRATPALEPQTKSVSGRSPQPGCKGPEQRPEVAGSVTLPATQRCQTPTLEKVSAYAMHPHLLSKKLREHKESSSGLYILSGELSSTTLSIMTENELISSGLKLKDEGSNRSIIYQAFADKHRIPYSTDNTLVLTAGGEATKVVGITDRLPVIYAHGTPHETTVHVQFLVMKDTAGLYDVLYGTDATHAVDAYVRPSTQQLQYCPRLQTHNDLDTVHSLPVKVVCKRENTLSANSCTLLHMPSPAHTAADRVPPPLTYSEVVKQSVQLPHVSHKSEDVKIHCSVQHSKYAPQDVKTPEAGNVPLHKLEDVKVEQQSAHSTRDVKTPENANDGKVAGSVTELHIKGNMGGAQDVNNAGSTQGNVHADAAAQVVLSFVLVLMMHRLSRNQTWASTIMHYLCLVVSLPCIMLYHILAIERQFIICTKKVMHYALQYCMTPGKVRKRPRAGQRIRSKVMVGIQCKKPHHKCTPQEASTRNKDASRTAQGTYRFTVLREFCIMACSTLLLISAFCSATDTPHIGNTSISLSMQGSQ